MTSPFHRSKLLEYIHLPDGPILWQANKVHVPVAVLPYSVDLYSDSKMFKGKGGGSRYFMRLWLQFLQDGSPTITTRVGIKNNTGPVIIYDNELVWLGRSLTKWADICAMDRCQ